MSDSMQSFIVKILITFGTAWATKNGVAVDGSNLNMLAGGLVAAAAGAWGIYQHWAMKKVPVTAVAIQPATQNQADLLAMTPKGQQVVNVSGTVVGALAALFLFGSTHYTHAQGKTPVINSLAGWADQDLSEAIALAATVPDIQDGIGQACWKTFQGIASVLKAHPLPLALKLASDIEAARLVAMGLNRVCSDPNCSQVWNDMQNTVAAMSVLPTPFVLSSVCSKIPLVKSSPATPLDANANPVSPVVKP